MLYDHLAVSPQGHLLFAGYDTAQLTKEYGTPLMLLDEGGIRRRCREYKQAMGRFLPAGSRPLYAGKALSVKQIYRIMAQENMGIDVVSAGELYTAVQAGFPLENAYFHGNSKTDADIRFAMECGVGCFVCDNAEELDAIDAQAARCGIRQRILLRLSPGIDPHTHEKINTGRVDCKFGAAVATGQAEELTLRALSKSNIILEGFHCHIGSQIFESAPFCDAAVIMLEFAAAVFRKHGYCLRVLNLGGGMGVPYTCEDPVVDYTANIRRIGEVINDTCRRLKLEPPAVLMEPGRSIVAAAGATLYSVTSTKQIPGYKNYAAVDGGMTDNPRYTLYKAAYTVLPASRMNEAAKRRYTVAGCCCESGDILQEDVCLPELTRGDLLAVLTTGAYNYSMASNYNRVPRPPIVMLDENDVRVVVRRETHEDMLCCDL